MKAVILAGGGGTRLWPLSRKKSPKQTEPVIGADTLLGATYARIRKSFAPADVLVATMASQAGVVRSILPELPARNLIAEPCRRETAAAIGFAALRIAAEDPDETFVVVNCDAHIRDEETYLRTLADADAIVRRNPERIAIIGIVPTYAETGYGYIRMGEAFDGPGPDGASVHLMERFVEKPDAATAESYLREGGYLWNATILVARAGTFLALYDRHLPAHAELFRAMASAFGTPDEEAVVNSCFQRLPAISVDYGILEKESGLLVIPADFGWADIGNWRTVRDILSAGTDENVVRGRHVGVDSRRNLIMSSSGKLVATAGLEDMIIVETGDALLICPHDRAHDVKRIVAELEKDKELEPFL